MTDFLNKAITYIKDILSAALLLVLTYLGYKAYSQSKTIKSLENEHDQTIADNATKSLQGELNVQIKEEQSAQNVFNTSTSDFESSKSELDKLRSNRPK